MSDTITNFFKLSNEVIEEERLQKLSDSAFRLLVYLKQKEHRYGKRDNIGQLYFWRTDEQIAKDMKKNIKTVKKAKKELIEEELIWTNLVPYTITHPDGSTSMSKKHVTVYRVLI